MKSTKFRVPVLLTALLLLGMWFASALQPASAQSVNPTPTVLIEPTISPLQSTIATQQTQIEKLERDQAQEVRDREYDVRDLQWKWGIAGAIAGIAITLLSWIGFNNIRDAKSAVEKARRDWEKSVKDLEMEWEKRAQLMLDKAIFKFDPSNLSVRLPNDAAKIHQLLTRRSLGRVEFYDNYEDLKEEELQGIIVISMLEKDQLAVSEEKFRLFVQRRKLDPSITGIILYTGPNRISDETVKAFDNMVTANYPATVVSNILVVGRGLKSDTPNSKQPGEP